MKEKNELRKNWQFNGKFFEVITPKWLVIYVNLG